MAFPLVVIKFQGRLIIVAQYSPQLSLILRLFPLFRGYIMYTLKWIQSRVRNNTQKILLPRILAEDLSSPQVEFETAAVEMRRSQVVWDDSPEYANWVRRSTDAMVSDCQPLCTAGDHSAVCIRSCVLRVWYRLLLVQVTVACNNCQYRTTVL